MQMLTNKFSIFVVNNPKGIPYSIRILNNLPHTFWKSEKHGKALVNCGINNVPVPEMHLPGFNYCGPFTKLEGRLACGDPRINPLDEACKKQYIAYRDNKDIEKRHKADRELQLAAKERMNASDASLLEKVAATAVRGIMYGKRKFGMGCSPQPASAGAGLGADDNGLGL